MKIEERDALLKRAHAVSGRERNANMLKIAKSALSRHEIVSENNGRWTLQAPDKNPKYKWEHAYWTEVILLGGCKILVHGDIEHVIYAYHDRTDTPREALGWMGDHQDISYYVKQKAVIGTGHALIEVVDPGVFAYDVIDRAFEYTREEYDDAKHWCEAAERVADGDHHELVKQSLYEHVSDTESMHHLGEVADSRVYYTHAALARLCMLLDARTKQPTPEASHVQ